MEHLALIMDGNRRWAKEQGLPGYKGHQAGAKAAIQAIKNADELGIKNITIWGLSTDNLEKRGSSEVAEILKILAGAKKYLGEIEERNGRIELIGEIDKLPFIARKSLDYLVNKTKKNTGIRIILALVYGGQNEIIRGIKNAVAQGADLDNLTENDFLSYLDTGKYPPPDLIVRTGGDIRHSGFLLYRSDYSEYYFTKKKWPDFDKDEMNKALAQFKGSKRNFGK